MLERMSFAESQVEDFLELNFRYVDYQTLAHLSYRHHPEVEENKELAV